jgi:hypothetical protein
VQTSDTGDTISIIAAKNKMPMASMKSLNYPEVLPFKDSTGRKFVHYAMEFADDKMYDKLVEVGEISRPDLSGIAELLNVDLDNYEM